MRAYFAVLLGFLVCVSVARGGEISSKKYLKAVEKFADTVLQHGRDKYGEKKTPLFVDGLHSKTLEPARWISKDGEVWVMSNFASQQHLMRTLDGLTAITGDKKYRKAAEDAASYVLKNLRADNGLIYWGGHCLWDLEGECPEGEHHLTHELKNHQPYWDLMWRVDPKATREVIGQIWAGHITDWSKLGYNRHASTQKPYAPQWDAEFDTKTKVPFEACDPKGKNLSFCCTTTPLVHSMGVLASLGDDDKALTWTRRLIHRWQEARHPKTGLSGGLLSYRVKRPDRAKEAFIHVHPQICEAEIAGQGSRYGLLMLEQMWLAEDFIEKGGKCADIGRDFIKWASEDLKIMGKHCYDKKNGQFIYKLTDGTVLKYKEAKPGYFIPETFAPRKPTHQTLWCYAMAYRLTGDFEHWRMMREIAPHIGIGDIGNPGGKGRSLVADTDECSWRLIYALLELRKATNDNAFLELACKIGDNLLEWQTKTGLFPRPGKKWGKDGEPLPHSVIPGVEEPQRVYARTSDDVPLVLLHLAAAIDGRSNEIPDPVWDMQYLHCRYGGELEEYQKKRDDTRTYDNKVFYGGGF